MPIYATAGNGTDFKPAPEGVHQAICVDVIDLGLHENKFRPGSKQHKVNLAWQIGELRDDGKPFLLFKRYTLSINEKATLCHDLQSWRGKPFTMDERARFDVETVIGANCLLNVQHNQSADGTKTYANVMTVMPLVKGMPKMALPADYIRVKDRTPDEQASHAAESEDITDESIPF
jgi:hypothetical protein